MHRGHALAFPNIEALIFEPKYPLGLLGHTPPFPLFRLMLECGPTDSLAVQVYRSHFLLVGYVKQISWCIVFGR
jgi:hypothetical protein